MVCKECESEFSFPVTVKEIHYELPEKPVEIFCECPYCGSMDIDESERGAEHD